MQLVVVVILVVRIIRPPILRRSEPGVDDDDIDENGGYDGTPLARDAMTAISRGTRPGAGAILFGRVDVIIVAVLLLRVEKKKTTSRRCDIVVDARARVIISSPMITRGVATA